MANVLDNKLREDLERLKKIRAHRGLRHYWGLRVRLLFILFASTLSYLSSSSGERSTHQDYWSQGKNCWCVEEEVNSRCCVWKRINALFISPSICVS